MTTPSDYGIHDIDIENHEPLIYRLHRALGPLAGGIILDTMDLLTFGPIGLAGGFLLAMAIGWWVSGIYEFETRARLIFALLAGIYAAIPFTEVFPIATAISALARFRQR